MGRYALNMEKYADLARTASAEGCVLLKNDNSTPVSYTHLYGTA